jgi:threonine aldolase
MIDLRSDTLTKPCPEMLEIMFTAEVGDDVFEEDPTVLKLERKAAELFGMEASLFCTSGTQTNQLAIMAQTQPGDEVICHEHAHIYLYEGGGMCANAQVSPKLLKGDRGRIQLGDLISMISNPYDIHQAKSSFVGIENTMNKGGGSIYDFSEISKISKFCKENNLTFHLDGARLFNALVESSETEKDFGAVFNSISICLSKGLGAPVGSLLLGTQETIIKAKRIRKRLGGGWRQAGYLAAAGLYALENNISRLKEDHKRAKIIASFLEKRNFVDEIYPVETNIVIIKISKDLNQSNFLKQLEQKGIKAVGFGPQLIRFVTHLDFNDTHLEQMEKILLHFDPYNV